MIETDNERERERDREIRASRTRWWWFFSISLFHSAYRGVIVNKHNKYILSCDELKTHGKLNVLINKHIFINVYRLIFQLRTSSSQKKSIKFIFKFENILKQ